MITAAVLFVHLVSFAAVFGSAFAQQQLMRSSAKAGVPAAERDALERMAATVVTKVQLPALFGSIGSGLVFVAQNPALMRFGWLHAKLTCVLVLAVVSHLEMFNARKIVRARADGGAGADDDAAERKRRHSVFGGISALTALVILVLVTFVRLGA